MGEAVAKDMGIDVEEKEVIDNENDNGDGVIRKIREGEEQEEVVEDKQVVWIKWVPEHTVELTCKEIQKELEEKRKKKAEEEEKKTTTTKR